MEKDFQLQHIANILRHAETTQEFQVFSQALAMYLTDPEGYGKTMRVHIGEIEHGRVVLAAEEIKRELAMNGIISQLRADPLSVFHDNLE